MVKDLADARPERRADRTALTSERENWPVSPPFGLGDPRLAAYETSQAEFGQERERGTPDPGW